MDRQQFIPVLMAARMLNISPLTLRRRLDRVGVELHCDPLDRRLRLIRRDVLPALASPADATAHHAQPLPEADRGFT
jgi:hypothetical protein